jgi:hypothetical protein
MNAIGQVRALEGRSIHLIKEKRGWRFTIHNKHGNEIDIGASYAAESFDALVAMIRKYVDVA